MIIEGCAAITYFRADCAGRCGGARPSQRCYFGGAMSTKIMNSETTLYFRSEAASWKGAEEGVSVACLYMGGQTGRLEKCSGTKLAVECVRSGYGISRVFLEVIVHRALVCLFSSTVRAKKLPILCFGICEGHWRSHI